MTFSEVNTVVIKFGALIVFVMIYMETDYICVSSDFLLLKFRLLVQ